MERWYKVALCAVSIIFVVAWVKPQKVFDKTLYQTTVGTGPDKWASVWLIRTHLNPSAVTIAQSENAFIPGAVSFDTDSSAMTRTGVSTTFSAFLEAHNISDPVTVKLGKIIHDIEINAWNPNREVESLQIENAFRQMQLRYGREKVSQACYMAFFKRVAESIKNASITLETESSRFIPPETCLAESDSQIADSANLYTSSQVPELELATVLDSMHAQKNVVFLDTREAFEFAEGHIPGAVNLTLRDINADSAQSLIDADLVIAYCVKDFRGFEAARKLRKHSVNAVIMNPYGIKGWRKAGFPVVGSRGLSQSEADEQMQKILLQHLTDQDRSS